jgi:hypothetical protein
MVPPIGFSKMERPHVNVGEHGEFGLTLNVAVASCDVISGVFCGEAALAGMPRESDACMNVALGERSDIAIWPRNRQTARLAPLDTNTLRLVPPAGTRIEVWSLSSIHLLDTKPHPAVRRITATRNGRHERLIKLSFARKHFQLHRPAFSPASFFIVGKCPDFPAQIGNPFLV